MIRNYISRLSKQTWSWATWALGILALFADIFFQGVFPWTLYPIIFGIGIIIGGYLVFKEVLEEKSRIEHNLNRKTTELENKATQQANVKVYFDVKYKTVHTQMPRGVIGTVPNTRVTRNLIIENIGNAEARNINAVFEVNQGNGRIPRSLQNIQPIPILAPDSKVPIRLYMASGDGFEFICTWTWNNPDGTSESQKSYLAIPHD